MSRTKPNDLERAELAFPCLTCDAEPGDWCVSRSGAWAPYLHEPCWSLWRRRQLEAMRAKAATARAAFPP